MIYKYLQITYSNLFASENSLERRQLKCILKICTVNLWLDTKKLTVKSTNINL